MSEDSYENLGTNNHEFVAVLRNTESGKKGTGDKDEATAGN